MGPGQALLFNCDDPADGSFASQLVFDEILRTEWQEGGFAPPLAHRQSVGRLERAGVRNRPNHVQKVLGTIPVLSDNKEKNRLAASST